MTTRGEVEETAYRWRQFAALPTTRVHWEWRDGWRAGRRSYWWYIDLGDRDDVRRAAAGSLADLGAPWLDPAVHLHISLQKVGFTDEVAPDVADRLLQAARATDFPEPLQLTLGPVDPNPEAVVLRVSPWEPIRRYRLMLRRLTAPLVTVLPGADDHFWPHVSIGYVNQEVPTAPVLARLRGLPPRPPATVTVDRLHLVRLGRDNRTWSWDRLGEVQIGRPPPAA